MFAFTGYLLAIYSRLKYLLFNVYLFLAYIALHQMRESFVYIFICFSSSSVARF